MACLSLIMAVIHVLSILYKAPWKLIQTPVSTKDKDKPAKTMFAEKTHWERAQKYDPFSWLIDRLTYRYDSVYDAMA